MVCPSQPLVAPASLAGGRISSLSAGSTSRSSWWLCGSLQSPPTPRGSHLEVLHRHICRDPLPKSGHILRLWVGTNLGGANEPMALGYSGSWTVYEFHSGSCRGLIKCLLKKQGWVRWAENCALKPEPRGRGRWNLRNGSKRVHTHGQPRAAAAATQGNGLGAGGGCPEGRAFVLH